MVCRSRELPEEERGLSHSFTDLLFTTMCIIGLQVEVHVKDGSVYSGIFHASNVEGDYGIVLKKAMMTKKGKRVSNVSNTDLVETLIVLSEDLVQVVAKGISLPTDDVAGNVAAKDAAAIVGGVSSVERSDREAKTRKQGKSDVHNEHINKARSPARIENGYAHGFMPATAHHLGVKNRRADGLHTEKIQGEDPSGVPVNKREVEDGKPNGKQGDCRAKSEFVNGEFIQEIQGPAKKLDACHTKSDPSGVVHVKTTSMQLPTCAPCDSSAPSTVKLDSQIQESRISENIRCSDTMTSRASNSLASVLTNLSVSCLSSSASPAEMVLTRSSGSNGTAKESKLNPGAKIFCPSSANLRSTTPPAAPTVASVTYIPDNCPMVPIAASQPEVDISAFAPRSSVPVKFVPYGNMMTGFANSDAQYPQPVVGHVGSRTQPIRYGGQYSSVQAGPIYVHPNPQNVVVGRFGGQLVYVHPVSHDVTQSVAALSQVGTRPLLNPHQVHLPKHQVSGVAAAQALQMCVNPPFIPSGQQPFVMPSHIPFTQSPFPVIRPISVPGSNGYFGAKFP